MVRKSILLDFGNPKTFKTTIARMKKARTRVIRVRNFFNKLSSDLDKIYWRKLRRELAEYPSPRYKLKPKYSSQKQHDYVMFLARTRKIVLPTQRSDKLAKSWDVKTKVSETGIDLTISTSDEKAQFVVGKVGITEKKAEIRKLEAPIQPFARANRWRPVHTVVTPVVLQARKYANKKTEEWGEHLFDDRDFNG